MGGEGGNTPGVNPLRFRRCMAPRDIDHRAGRTRWGPGVCSKIMIQRVAEPQDEATINIRIGWEAARRIVDWLDNASTRPGRYKPADRRTDGQAYRQTDEAEMLTWYKWALKGC